MKSLTTVPGCLLRGTIGVPGDKSVTHRAKTLGIKILDEIEFQKKVKEAELK